MRLTTKLAVAVSLLGSLIYMINWPDTATAIRNIDVRWIAAALLVSMAGNVISAEKWRGLLGASGIGISLGLAARLYWIGSFFSNFLPTSIGGDAVRLLLTPAPGRRQQVAGSIVIERTTGLMVLLVITGLGLAAAAWLVPRLSFDKPLLLPVGALALATMTILLLPGCAAALLTLIMARVPHVLRRPIRIAEQLARTIAGQVRNRGAILRALALSVPFYATVVLAQYCCLRAVGGQVPLEYALLFGASIQLMAVLPVSINGLGVSEGAFVALYAALGMPPSVAFAAAIMRRLVDLANSAVGGLLWLADHLAAGASPTRCAVSAMEQGRRADVAPKFIA
jgi:uncharacterized protein (TIRG00374 family)